MKTKNSISTQDILRFASRIEKEQRARGRKIDFAEAEVIASTAQMALRLAKNTGRSVRVWNRQAMPTAYRWSGWKYSRWIITALPSGWLTLNIDRAKGPCNDKSFVGLECHVEGLKARDLLWMAGRQRERTLRFDAGIIEAAEKCA